MKSPLLRHIVPVIVAIGLFAVGCGGEDGGQSGQMGDQAPPAQQQPGANPEQAPPPGAQQGPPSPGDLDQADIDEEQIEAAGRVFAKMQQAEQDYIESEGPPQNQQDQQEAQQHMQEELKQHIAEEEGITGQEFNRVMKLAQQNPEVRRSFMEAIEEAGGQPPQPRQQPAPNNQQQPSPNN